MAMRDCMAITKVLADENRVRMLLALQGGEAKLEEARNENGGAAGDKGVMSARSERVDL